MADVTPTGYAGRLIEAARDLIAASTSWRTLTSTSDAAGARAYTFANWYGSTPTKPVAVVVCDSFTVQHSSMTEYQFDGTVSVMFVFPLSANPDATPQASITNAENSVCAVLADMLNASNTSTYLPIISAEKQPGDGVRFSTPGQPYHATGCTISIRFSPIYD